MSAQIIVEALGEPGSYRGEILRAIEQFLNDNYSVEAAIWQIDTEEAPDVYKVEFIVSKQS